MYKNKVYCFGAEIVMWVQFSNVALPFHLSHTLDINIDY